jgi:hypothetical protein
MKIKIKDFDYLFYTNIDGRVKSRKNKLRIHNPPKTFVYPKPGGIILKTKTDITVYKEDETNGLILKRTNNTLIYKQNP